MITKKWYIQIIQFNFTTSNISCHIIIIIIIHVAVHWSPFCCHIVTHKVKSMGSVSGKWEEGSSTTPSSSTDQHRHTKNETRGQTHATEDFIPTILRSETLFLILTVKFKRKGILSPNFPIQISAAEPMTTTMNK